jgi:hypothetical protein
MHIHSLTRNFWCSRAGNAIFTIESKCITRHTRIPFDPQLKEGCALTVIES